jgi:hypothetical protein
LFKQFWHFWERSGRDSSAFAIVNGAGNCLSGVWMPLGELVRVLM